MEPPPAPRPYRSTAQQVVLGLMWTADAVRRALQSVAESEGLTLQQFNVLRILRGAGEDGLPTLEVADRMIERTPGVTRLLDRLERDGLIHRNRCPEDRRRVIARITEEGRNRLARLDVPFALREDALLEPFPAGNAPLLLSALRELRTSALRFAPGGDGDLDPEPRS